MINVKLFYSDDELKEIEIAGHANYANYGSDIVCSAVSVLAFTIANELIARNESTKIKLKDNNFTFTNLSGSNVEQILLTTLVNGLKSIEEQYKENVKITEVKKC